MRPAFLLSEKGSAELLAELLVHVADQLLVLVAGHVGPGQVGVGEDLFVGGVLRGLGKGVAELLENILRDAGRSAEAHVGVADGVIAHLLESGDIGSLFPTLVNGGGQQTHVAALDVGGEGGAVAHGKGNEAAQHVGDQVSGLGVVDVVEGSAGHLAQVGHGEGLGIAGGAEVQGLLLGVGDQIVQSLVGRILGNHDAVAVLTESADVLKAVGSVGDLQLVRNQSQRRQGGDADGVAVVLGVGHLGDAHSAGTAGHVGNGDGAAELLGRGVSQSAGRQVGAAAGGVVDDHGDGAAGVLGLLAAAAGGQGEDHGQAQKQRDDFSRFFHFHSSKNDLFYAKPG